MKAFDVWLVVAADDSVEPGVYGVYTSREVAEKHRSLMRRPERFEVEFARALPELDPVVFPEVAS